MNDYLLENRWDGDDFRDPMYFDTKLTAKGEEQAKNLKTITKFLHPFPEIIVASPLRRAMRTAELAFSDEKFKEIPRVTCHIARERVFHASDVGRSVSDIKEEFPQWCVAEIAETFGERPWWYVGEGGGDEADTTSSTLSKQTSKTFQSSLNESNAPVLRSGVQSEPPHMFESRMSELINWISNRPEQTIAVVAHWGVWFSLTGREFENCELVEFELQELEPGKGKMPV